MAAQTHCPQEEEIICRFLKCFKLDPGFGICPKPFTQFLMGKAFLPAGGSGLPFLEAAETVPNDDHPGKGIYGPVAPQQIVVQSCTTVWHVENGGLALDTVLAFLWKQKGAKEPSAQPNSSLAWL